MTNVSKVYLEFRRAEDEAQTDSAGGTDSGVLARSAGRAGAARRADRPMARRVRRCARRGPPPVDRAGGRVNGGSAREDRVRSPPEPAKKAPRAARIPAPPSAA